MQAEEEWYTPQEVAARCGLSRRRVYDWLAWGWLRGERRGGRWAVAAGDWEFFRRTCRGAGGRLMPSLRGWPPLWAAWDAQRAARGAQRAARGAQRAARGAQRAARGAQGAGGLSSSG